MGDSSFDLDFDSSITDEIFSQVPMPSDSEVLGVQDKRFSTPITDSELNNAAKKSYSDNTRTKVNWVLRLACLGHQQKCTFRSQDQQRIVKSSC